MEYTCSVCKEKVSGGLIPLQDHTDRHIVDLLKIDHPDWVEGSGVCQKCVDYYRSEIRGTIFKDAACAIRNRKIKGFWTGFKNIFQKKN